MNKPNIFTMISEMATSSSSNCSSSSGSSTTINSTTNSCCDLQRSQQSKMASSDEMMRQTLSKKKVPTTNVASFMPLNEFTHINSSDCLKVTHLNRKQLKMSKNFGTVSRSNEFVKYEKSNCDGDIYAENEVHICSILVIHKYYSDMWMSIYGYVPIVNTP